ncbi:uncharacterized protein LOC8260347 [Ricinus communis]|uniref:uncharacterized protein LOC8260347 n=1 Tax=Ricinus communis TaxID=3988 RepID=UPI00201AC166|nr:uncharacterized protein LOC8260347 [Ricinus communis]
MSWEVAKEIFSSDLVRQLWDAFEIQALVVTSLGFQMVLAVYGRRRKYNSGVYVRFIVWFCYLMGTYVSTVALGKLTETSNDSIALTNITYGDVRKVNVTNNELRAIWAPLLLVHIGGPDSITAYAVEDNRLGYRQFLELGVQIGVVLLIFLKAWNNSWLSIIALTLLVGGAIKSLERVWCLRCSASTQSVFDTLSNSDILEAERVWFLKSSVPGLELLVKAYRRFEHLKPHLQNWIGHPLSINFPSMSTYYYDPEDVFRIAEFELGFMYDVLFTRSPINYSWASFLRRFICFLSLVFSLCGFAILFRNADVRLLTILVSRKYDKMVDIAITYLLLSGAIALELYALASILYSDWALLYMIKDRKSPFVENLLQLFARQVPMRWPRWSNCMEQLNLLQYCLYHDPTLSGRLISRILKIRGWDERLKRYRLTSYVIVPGNMKKLIIEQIEEVSGQRVWQPFSKRGEWALERFKCLDQFNWSIQTDYTTEANQQTSFGRAIIIWHIATDVWYYAPEKFNKSKNTNYDHQQQLAMAKYLSDYMMLLLAERPCMLSIGTRNVLFEGACAKLAIFLKNIESTRKETESMIHCFSRNLLESRFEDSAFGDQVTIDVDDVVDGFHTSDAIISDWDVVMEAKLLAELLIDRADRWSLLASIWIEMLCYAASNCPWVRHTEQLRRGGGLITHVWLLLNHETNKFNISIY